MSVRRTIAHGPSGGWSAVAVHLETAEASKEGFYLTLFPDGKTPSVVFLRPPQLSQLLDMAASSSASDLQLWDAVAKVPLEPLLPNRSLSSRLRALLVDQASAIREQIRLQAERIPAPQAPLAGEAGEEGEEEAGAVVELQADPADSGEIPPWKPPSNFPQS